MFYNGDKKKKKKIGPRQLDFSIDSTPNKEIRKSKRELIIHSSYKAIKAITE